MRMRVPNVLLTGQRATIELEIWNASGKPLAASKVVVTVEDPRRTAAGFSAAKIAPGSYRFSRRFAAVGRHIVRVFPPVADTTFEVDLDVVAGDQR